MSKRERKIYSKQCVEYKNSNFIKTGYSNSRLGVNEFYISDPSWKIKFERKNWIY